MTTIPIRSSAATKATPDRLDNGHRHPRKPVTGIGWGLCGLVPISIVFFGLTLLMLLPWDSVWATPLEVLVFLGGIPSVVAALACGSLAIRRRGEHGWAATLIGVVDLLAGFLLALIAVLSVVALAAGM